MMNTRHFRWFLWAFGLLMVAIALASFFGGLMTPAYGVLALVTAAATAGIGYSLRTLDELLGLSEPEQASEESADPPPWRNKRRTAVEWLLTTALVLWAVFAGLSITVVTAIFLGCIVIVGVIEMRLMRRWMRRNRSPRTH